VEGLLAAEGLRAERRGEPFDSVFLDEI